MNTFKKLKIANICLLIFSSILSIVVIIESFIIWIWWSIDTF